jgi:diaminohydroxyphosphoribosylaminopyrimidine deaminase/5-amino-6-(5-phosphoribosylamino)uracil reductase
MLQKHQQYMSRAIALCLKGFGKVHTNPLVGCVIVYNNKIIGEGYHQIFGKAHAEVNAINSVSESDRKYLSKSTLYVTLEPCCHFGKTPPCTDLIIHHKIPKVVVACLDPFEKVRGKGIKKLAEAGIAVSTGIMENEAKEANNRFLTFQTQKRPYIILKWAQSKNGIMAADNANDKKISGNAAQLLLHKWRSEETAFLIGEGTLLQDNPELTTRLVEGKNPQRIALANASSEMEKYAFFKQSEPAILFGNKHKVENLNGAKLIHEDTKNMQDLLQKIHELNVLSLVVEGGVAILDFFIENNVFDEIRVFSSKNKFIKGKKAPDISNLKVKKHKEVDLGEDVLMIYKK